MFFYRKSQYTCIFYFQLKIYAKNCFGSHKFNTRVFSNLLNCSLLSLEPFFYSLWHSLLCDMHQPNSLNYSHDRLWVFWSCLDVNYPDKAPRPSIKGRPHETLLNCQGEYLTVTPLLCHFDSDSKPYFQLRLMLNLGTQCISKLDYHFICRLRYHMPLKRSISQYHSLWHQPLPLWNRWRRRPRPPRLRIRYWIGRDCKILWRR
mgnify:CR=1 FL=1